MPKIKGNKCAKEGVGVLKKGKSLEADVTRQLYAMSALPLFIVILFSYVPLVGCVIAFKQYRFDLGIFGSKWVGFKNFEFFFKSNDFWSVTWNTLSMNFLFIVIGTIVSVLLALLFYELNSRMATKVFQTIFITPHFLSWVVVAYMAYAFLQPQYGFLNRFLNLFGIKSVEWYSTPKAWPSILVLASVWKTAGMDCVVYYAALMGMDTSILEAAHIDGANRRQTTIRIILPQLLMLISVMTIIKIGGIFRADFGLFYQLPMNSPQLYSVTDVVDTYLYRVMRESNNMSVSTAIGLLQAVVGLVLVMLTNYFSKKVDEDIGLF